MKQNLGFTQLAILLAVGFVIVTGVSIAYVANKNTRLTPSPIPVLLTSPSPEASESAQPSPLSSPSQTSQIKTTTTTAPARSGFHLATATIDYGSERRMLTLTGNSFGSNSNRVIFDDDATKYKDYDSYNWFNNKIELFLPKEVGDNQTVKVAVLRQDGTKSNTLTFRTKPWDKSANSKIDCKTPTNFRGNAVSSTEIQLNWDTDPNVKRFEILQLFYGGNQQGDWFYPANISSFDSMNNGSVKITGLTPNTANTFSVRVWCSNNNYASQASPSITINTP